MEAEREPQPDTPVFDFIWDRIPLWIALGSFGAVLGGAMAALFARTGSDSNGLAALVGATAALALAAVAEIGLSVRTMLEKQFPDESIPSWAEPDDHDEA